jgi:dTDP-glucose 4,6-dehydratase
VGDHKGQPGGKTRVVSSWSRACLYHYLVAGKLNASNTILVTGGAGFIGSNFVLAWFKSAKSGKSAKSAGTPLVNLDLLTYAGNPANLAELEGDARYTLVRGDICDADLVKTIFAKHRPRAVVHFAAESHVDRSIASPEAFIRTNVHGTFVLLDQARAYWESLAPEDRDGFRFLHVSTDEVYGTLGPDDAAFCETTPYAPNSPYAASKAGSDHLARAYFHTFGLPVLTTNCSNNYGPYQFPEKLIPLMILNALEGKPLPVYGDGKNVRDWLFVQDHCTAIQKVLEAGRPGETYNIGGNSEKANIDVVTTICNLVDELRPGLASGAPRTSLITYVTDRLGHDRRYAIDASKINNELGWKPEQDFEGGLRRTVEWYLGNSEWIANVRTGAYREWIEKNYSERAVL